MSVGLNTNLNNFGYTQSFGSNSTGLTNSGISSLNTGAGIAGTLNNPLFPMVTNNYEQDMLMPQEFKMSALNNVQPSESVQNNQEVQQTVNQSSFTSNQNTEVLENSNVNNSVNNSAQLDNYLLAKDKNIAVTENGNFYKETNSTKKALAFLGFLAPAAGKIVQLFKGGKFKDLFKFKQLAVACPVVALAGFGIGSLIDSYINSQRAKAADASQMYMAAQNVSQPVDIKA